MWCTRKCILQILNKSLYRTATEGILEKTVEEETELDSSENDSVPIPKHCWNITTQHAVNVLMPDSVDYVDREIDRRYLEEEDDERYVPVKIVDEIKKELKEEVKKKKEEELKEAVKKKEEELKEYGKFSQI